MRKTERRADNVEYLRCYAQVSLEAISHNIEEVKKRLAPGVKVLAVVKADAYGHGVRAVSRHLERQVDYFAVATLEEALELRSYGIEKPVLVLSYVSPSQYEQAVSGGITLTVDTVEQGEALARTAMRLQKKAKLHLAVDTGMTRIGFQVREEEADRIASFAKAPWLDTEGIFTHFSCADQSDKTYCGMQLEKFDRMCGWLKERGIEPAIRHICNSAGIMEFEEYRFDMVRSGIVTYGMYPSEEVQKERLSLRPALEWKAHVIHVKEVEAGVSVGYGATYTTTQPMTRIATVSVGYADGYPRALSQKGTVLIRGKRARILGRICMDQMMVDVTAIPEVQVEDVVTLVGKDGTEEITIEEIAEPVMSFNYEMVCRIGKRVPRVYREG